jgi:hypothetical protein
MDNEITINGVTYVRKDTIAKDTVKYEFKKGCEYFTFASGNPDAKMNELQKNFPEKNVFFVGKAGYCGKVCLEVDIEDITVDFLKKLLYVSRDFFEIIDNEIAFAAMVTVEMCKPTLHR